jgi:hypothetical protein
LCIKRRAGKPPSEQTGATIPELLYTDWLGESDDHWESLPHRIVKKTKKLVSVEKHRYHSDPWNRVTYALNRAELEAAGSVWSRSARERFHTTPYEQRHQPWAPPELVLLGLKRGASKEQIKAAYRRMARQHHPDCGGNAEKFKELQAAYERAMA